MPLTRGVLLLLLLVAALSPAPLLAGNLGWTMSFQAAADLSCDQFESALARDDWNTTGVDAAALAASHSLWVRLSPGADPQPAVVVARNQIASEWVDYRDPGTPQRRSTRNSPGSTAPGLLGVELPDDPVGPVHLCLGDRPGSTSAVRTQAIGLLAAAEFRAAQRSGFAVLAAAMGVMLAMAALSLAFHAGLREQVFADYGIYVLCFAIYVLHSVDALPWLFPQALREGPSVRVFALLAMAVMAVHGLRFTLAFTGMGEAWPRLSRITRRIARIALFSALVTSLGVLLGENGLLLRRSGIFVFNASIGLMILSVVGPVVEQAWRGRREARIYLLGWLPPLVVIFGFILRYLGITPESMRPSGSMLMQAAAFESLVLGWGIAERARYYRQARKEALHLAEHDPLTGALNRDAFARVLQRALQDPAEASLLFLDVDHFKPINDRHGHAAGDQVLRRLVQRCQGELRGVDALARLGGEEFVAMLAGAGREEAQRVAERIRLAISRDADAPLPVTVSIGLAVKRAEDSAESWLARADQALYAAKLAGRDRVAAVG